MTLFRFERLAAWQKAIDYADEIYTATEPFPSDERYGLTSQLRRAAVSISANVAEGSGRTSDADQSRFVEIAYSSLMETVSHLHIARRRSLIGEDVFDGLRSRADELARILSGLRSHFKGS